MTRSVLIAGLVGICGALALTGCGGSSEAGGQPVALRVNTLTLTSQELAQERRLASSYSHGFNGPDEEPAWLTSLIEQELLVQEAQRLGLDRQPAFMRTIEHFWKEALIKQLVERKAREISESVHVYGPQIEAYYQRLGRRTRARLLRCRTEAAARRLTELPGELEAALAASSDEILDDTGWQWYATGTLSSTLERVMDAVAAGARSRPALEDGRWVVIAVGERKTEPVPPLAELHPEIERTLRRQQEADAMERWIAQLRAQAHVVVNRAALEQLR